MRKLILSIFIFFFSSSLFAIPSLQETKSLELIQKLYEDKLYRLVLLEIDWLEKNYQHSLLLKKSFFFQGHTFFKIQKHQESQKSLSKIPLHLFNPKDQEHIFFTQAKNYFFLHQLNLSNSFFEFIQKDSFESSKESESIRIQASYYQILIAIFQGDIDRVRRILQKTPRKFFSKNQRKFLSLLQKKNISFKEFIKILDKNSLQNIQKLALVRFLAERDFKNKKPQIALEKYFFFTLYSTNFKEKPLLIYLDFFIGEALYKNSLSEFNQHPEQVTEKLRKEAEIYLTKHKSNNPWQSIFHSRLYLANIYASQKKYSESLEEYNLLLKNGAYFKNKNLVFNYIQLLQLPKYRSAKTQTEKIFIQAIELQDYLKDKQELSLQVIEFYQKNKNCNLVAKLFVDNEFSFLKLDEITQAKENFFAGKCYLNLNHWQKSFSYFKKIPFHFKEITLSTSAFISQALGNLKKEKENSQFFQRLQSFAKDTKIFDLVFSETEQKQIEQNSLLYYYYAKEWEKFAQKQEKYFSTKDQTPKDWRNWEFLAISQMELEQDPQASYYNAFDLVQDKAQKIRLAQKIILIHKSKKEYSKIAKIYEQLLEIIPPENQVALKLTIAKYYFQDNQPAQAKNRLLEMVKNLEIAKKSQKELTHQVSIREMNFYFEANYLLAEIEIVQNQLAKAIQILTATAELTTIENKWYRLIHYRLGKIYRSQENWQFALKHYQFVANTKENTPEKKDAIIRVKATKKLLASKNL